jgi:hypothetical protein
VASYLNPKVKTNSRSQRSPNHILKKYLPPVPESEQPQEPIQTLEPETIRDPEPVSTPIPTLTLESLYQEILTLKQLALEHSGMIVHLQQALAKKGKPVA